jgi:hypothetical protein
LNKSLNFYDEQKAILGVMGRRFQNLLQESREEYKSWDPIYVRALGEEVGFTMRGFNHLRFHTNRKRRIPQETLHKLNLLPFVREILQNANKIDDYRQKQNIEYWSFSTKKKEMHQHLVRVIVRKIGNGKPHFWSVMGLNK